MLRTHLQKAQPQKHFVHQTRCHRLDEAKCSASKKPRWHVCTRVGLLYLLTVQKNRKKTARTIKFAMARQLMRRDPPRLAKPKRLGKRLACRTQRL